jgi:hypothetical protein
MPKIALELDVPDAQELASTLRIKVKQIDWVLENKPPRKQGEAQDLDIRAKRLTIIANDIEIALHERALNNVVAIGEKK